VWEGRRILGTWRKSLGIAASGSGRVPSSFSRSSKVQEKNNPQAKEKEKGLRKQMKEGRVKGKEAKNQKKRKM